MLHSWCTYELSILKRWQSPAFILNYYLNYNLLCFISREIWKKSFLNHFRVLNYKILRSYIYSAPPLFYALPTMLRPWATWPEQCLSYLIINFLIKCQNNSKHVCEWLFKMVQVGTGLFGVIQGFCLNAPEQMSMVSQSIKSIPTC